MGRRSRELYSQDSHPMVRDPQMGAITVVAVLPKVGGGVSKPSSGNKKNL